MTPATLAKRRLAAKPAHKSGVRRRPAASESTTPIEARRLREERISGRKSRPMTLRFLCAVFLLLAATGCGGLPEPEEAPPPAVAKVRSVVFEGESLRRVVRWRLLSPAFMVESSASELARVAGDRFFERFITEWERLTPGQTYRYAIELFEPDGRRASMLSFDFAPSSAAFNTWTTHYSNAAYLADKTGVWKIKISLDGAVRAERAFKIVP